MEPGYVFLATIFALVVVTASEWGRTRWRYRFLTAGLGILGVYLIVQMRYTNGTSFSPLSGQSFGFNESWR